MDRITQKQNRPRKKEGERLNFKNCFTLFFHSDRQFPFRFCSLTQLSHSFFLFVHKNTYLKVNYKLEQKKTTRRYLKLCNNYTLTSTGVLNCSRSPVIACFSPFLYIFINSFFSFSS